jgi:hypothetical protein
MGSLAGGILIQTFDYAILGDLRQWVRSFWENLQEELCCLALPR